MVSLSVFITTLFSFMLITDAAIFRQIIKLKPGDPKLCDIEGESLKPGESMKHDKLCHSFHCSQGYNRNELQLEMHTCGVMTPPENCKIEYSSTDRYPECCEGRIICP